MSYFSNHISDQVWVLGPNLTSGFSFFNRWKLNNWDIDLTKDRYSMVGGRLIISNPEKSRDAGKYVCVVSNIFGTVRSSEATLSFGCKLMFMSKHRSCIVFC